MYSKVRLPIEPQSPLDEVSADAAITELQVAVAELQAAAKALFEQMRRAGIAQ